MPFRLADIRAIKEAVPDATVNNVILAIIRGALRQYLQAKAELPKDTLTAMAPTAVHGTDENAALGSLVSAMVGLGTQVEDPLERLRFVDAEAINSKAMTNAVGARACRYAQLMPAALAGIAARLYTRVGSANAPAPAFKCVVTIVPGSRVPLYFAGERLVPMYGTASVFDSIGLIFPVIATGRGSRCPSPPIARCCPIRPRWRRRCAGPLPRSRRRWCNPWRRRRLSRTTTRRRDRHASEEHDHGR